jgi:hypothetical protein
MTAWAPKIKEIPSYCMSLADNPISFSKTFILQQRRRLAETKVFNEKV